ncbi:cytochrome P450 [Parasitella parasitica]|nr:cytochrome P450 [Parasitella parasitica]
MMGTVISYIASIAITFIISKVGQKLIWHNKKMDGTPKSPWPPNPQGLSWFSGGYKEFEQDTYYALTCWSRQLGDLFSVRLGLKRIVVLNSADLVHKVLVEKEQLNSSRMPSDTYERLQTDQSKTVFAAPFDKYWSRIRRATYIVVGKMYAPQFSKLFKEQAMRLVYGIALEEGSGKLTAEQLRQLVDMITMDSALTMVLGPSKIKRDPVAIMTLIQKCHALETRQTRKYNRMAQFFPAINGWLDVKSLCALDSRDLDAHNQVLEVVLPWFEQVYRLRDDDVPLSQEQAKQWASNEQLDSITKSLLNIEPSKNDPEPVQLSKDEILVNAVHMIMHAYTYLASALFTLIQRLATEPKLQERLQQETTSEDKTLAYAFVNESLRCDTPNRILSYGPRTDYDLEWNNSLYRVDTDTEIVLNVHAIHSDSRYYSEPQSFNPTRFLQPPKMTSPLLENDNKPASDHLAFGAGRRACIASKASQDFLVATLIQLVKQYRLEGGDAAEKTESTTSIWSWTGRTETKGSTIEFIKR